MDAHFNPGALALFPPRIPVIEQSNKGGLGVLELRKDPPEDVIVTAIMPFGIQPNTTLVLYWDGVVVDSYPISQEQINTGLIVFKVPPAQIVDNNNAEYYYTSASPIGGNPDESEHRFVIVNTKVPGNPPLNSTEPVNSNLTPPRNIPNPVTDAHLPAGIDVVINNWVNMEVGDVLTLTWGNTRITRTPLTAPEIDNPVTINVDELTILANPNTLNLKVYYDIRDIVGNWSLNSLPYITDVEAGPDTMPAPVVKEAEPDDDIAVPGDLPGNVHVEVVVYQNLFPNENVKLIWQGLSPEGISIDESVTFTVPPIPGFTTIQEIKRETATAIIGGSATVYYEANGVRRSRRKAITVSGTMPALPKPQVLEQQNGIIDPDTLPATGATIRIESHPSIVAGDHLYLYWDGTTADGGSTHYSADRAVTAGGQTFVFPVDRTQHVDPLAGGSVKLYYAVVSGGGVSRDSEVENLNVKVSQRTVTDNFTGQAPQLIQQGGVINTNFVKISFISGTGSAGFPTIDSLPIDPGPLVLPLFHVCFQNPNPNMNIQVIMIDLQRDCSIFECDIHGLNAKTTIELLDNNSAVLTSMTPNQTNYHLKYATSTKPISFLRITADADWSLWDNLVMTT
ncbi:MAG: hypothetical protein ACOH2R_07460 [Pseudomonas sp.]